MAVGTEFVLYMVELGKVPGGLLTIQKVKKEASQVLSERCGPVTCSIFIKKLSKMAFTSSIYFCYRWIVYS